MRSFRFNVPASTSRPSLKYCCALVAGRVTVFSLMLPLGLLVRVFQGPPEEGVADHCSDAGVAAAGQETRQLLPASEICNATGCGIAAMETATGAETVVASELSVATAVSCQEPEGGFVQFKT